MQTTNISKSPSRLSNLSVKWKIILLSTLFSGAALVAGFAYFTYQSYWLNVTTALSGLMNFTDSKQQGVIKFIDQNKKLAKQLANLAEQASTKTLRNQFTNIVETDVFRLDDHPFKDEITAGTRNIPTWDVYHTIDYVSKGVIVVSSDPQREGKIWGKSIDQKLGYSDPYYDGSVPVVTFIGPSRDGTVYVNIDARMLTNIVTGEIGNMSGIGVYYLAGVGKTLDYYIVNKENLLITDSRTRPDQFLKGRGSDLPWRTTMKQASVMCGKDGVYTTNAKCTTGCREAMGFYRGVSGNTMLGASMPFYDSNWTLVVEQESNELLMPMWITFAQVFGIMLLLGGIAAYWFSYLVDKSIVSPLQSLQGAIEDIKNTRDFGRTINLNSDDEIGRLGGSFNSMSADLGDLYRNLDARIEERTQELNVINEQLRISAVAFDTHEAIVITDAHANIIRVNQAFQDITGYRIEDVLGKNPSILSSGRQDKEFYSAMWKRLLESGSWTGEIWDKRKNGQIYPKWMTITAVKDKSGKTTEYVAMFSDITARKKAEEEIYSLAFYDSLTNLPNRRHLLDRINQATSISARSNLYGALLFLDMDRFKTLNDTLGHDHGDLFLIEVARRMLHCVRDVDTVARIGGDEFVVLFEEIGADSEEVSQKVALIAEKMRAALSQPYQLKEHEYHSSPSIGVCLYRGNDESVDSLLKYADMAMYRAKESGRNAVRFFDPAMQFAVETHAALEADLRSAIPDQQFCLYYQIQLDNDHRPIGAEGLIRWIHPKRGLVSPAQFIPLAEESSLILEIGHWVLDTACRQLALWGKREQTRHLMLAVNVSAAQFKKHDFVDTVSTLVNIHQINPVRLKLELTEAVVLEDVTDVVAKMHALKALGVGMSLDDFGTGYSSLSYLKRLPLDQIKIDQSFVRDIATDVGDAVMVQTIINLALSFRLNVIAEGVETEGQMSFLKQHGCMAYQGYLFSKPVPIAEFEALLT